MQDRLALKHFPAKQPMRLWQTFDFFAAFHYEILESTSAWRYLSRAYCNSMILDALTEILLEYRLESHVQEMVFTRGIE